MMADLWWIQVMHVTTEHLHSELDGGEIPVVPVGLVLTCFNMSKSDIPSGTFEALLL